MNYKYQQQLVDLYMKKCINPYPVRRIYPTQYTNMLENTNLNNTGFIRLHIIDQVTKEPISYATITIYVTDGAQRDIPIMHLITTINPIRVELPMANELGTQLVGSEYNFSTYNIKVDAFAYFTRNIFNIRLFPGETTDFNIELVPITAPQAHPIIEERVDILPHPRDIIDGGNN